MGWLSNSVRQLRIWVRLHSRRNLIQAIDELVQDGDLVHADKSAFKDLSVVYFRSVIVNSIMLSWTLAQWQPFRIDAMGLVTILGADEMKMAVGRLVRSPITAWLPLLGAYTVANNQFTEPCH